MLFCHGGYHSTTVPTSPSAALWRSSLSLMQISMIRISKHFVLQLLTKHRTEKIQFTASALYVTNMFKTCMRGSSSRKDLQRPRLKLLLFTEHQMLLLCQSYWALKTGQKTSVSPVRQFPTPTLSDRDAVTFKSSGSALFFSKLYLRAGTCFNLFLNLTK